MKRIFIPVSIILLLLGYQISFASSGLFFNVEPTGSTLNITTTAPNHTYASAGIKINTSGYRLTNIGSDCILIKNGYCVFSVSDVANKAISITGASGALNITMCLNANGPLSCQNYNVNINERGYVSNTQTRLISLCPVDSNGTFGTCTTMTTTGVSISEPYQIAFTQANTTAYVVSRSDNAVRKCPVNTDGVFGTCVDSGNVGVAFDNPSGIALNRANSVAYVTNQGGDVSTGVSVCPINSDGGFGACVASGNTGVSFSSPNGIALNAAGNIAYVANYLSNTVSVCPIIANSTFGACQDSGNTGGAFSDSAGIVLNRAGNIAYVTNAGNNTVSLCPIMTDGTFGSCQDSGNTGVPFNGPFGVTLNKAGNIAYVVNAGNSTISRCPINANGTFGVCVTNGNSLNVPIWVTIS